MIITMKDGSKRELNEEKSIFEFAKEMNRQLEKDACAAELNGDIVDLRTMITSDCYLNILTFKETDGRAAFRHTTAHILAQAVKRLYPSTKLAIGPAITDGFYYDFEFDFVFTAGHLLALEEEMRKIIKEDIKLHRFYLSREDAIKLMAEKNEPYKVELINDLPVTAEISFYEQGDFTDLCSGPHLISTISIKAFKLMTIAGAYWRGNEKNKMLTRIYGTAFPKNSDLEEYLEQLEEARRRDHRRVGMEMGLFSIMDEGPGFPFFLPKGVILKNLLIDYWRMIHEREGYVEIETPTILNRELWETSGHWDHYRENMYTTIIDEEDYAIKPMNCPGCMLVYKSTPHSYKEFPLRIGELGLVHRHEKSGVLHGLMRARCFTQDDAHIFMTEEQVPDEIKGVIQLIDEVYSKFGFKYHVELSTRPANSIGSDEDWDTATNGLKQALTELNMDYIINEGDGAFYGPKIDFHLEDSIGRTWQCGTIQLDFQLPLRFHAEYTGYDGEKHRPIMIHRVVFGSIERFIGILIEHYAGKFPLWLSPVQIKILPLSDRFIEYAESVIKKLKTAGYRCEIDTRDEKIGYKIREAQLDKIPYMLIIGQKEKECDTLSVRNLEKGNLGEMNLSEFIKLIQETLKGQKL
ncbi:threonine--tRNA ligase [Anaerocolumna sedimenticola]|uniref:Threonine--tRNA ligase n=1 Tax=Anaerocolumna sedimenticola TaxID=2696063 RepID=A0A6P1TPE2_9FIRM|nr:threonine--tRNA ligase [Anaerocolumna sedimenticola]QHQ62313.1 threonine--tRNA ligase [Anaerocolumna sedimenticola]